MKVVPITSAKAWSQFNKLSNSLRKTITDIAVNELKLQDTLEVKLNDWEQDPIEMTAINWRIIGFSYVKDEVRLLIENDNGNTEPIELTHYKVDVVDLINVVESLENYANSTL